MPICGKTKSDKTLQCKKKKRKEERKGGMEKGGRGKRERSTHNPKHSRKITILTFHVHFFRYSYG